MGRYSQPLAAAFIDWIDPAEQALAADVGCGPGAVISALLNRIHPGAIRAADPSPSFVEAAKHRFPDVDIVQAPVDDLPWADDIVDLAVASLVVHFMPDPVRGIGQMGRITRPGGIVGATVWDLAGDRAPVSLIGRAAEAVGLGGPHEESRPGARGGDLSRFFEGAGLSDVEERELRVESSYASFDEWWEPYLGGVGPAGDFVRRLDDDGRARVRDECQRQLGDGPFTVEATAWAARGTA